MMPFIPFPPQMIDWASVSASIPEEEKKYQVQDTCAYTKMKHMPHNMANMAVWKKKNSNDHELQSYNAE